MAGLIKPSQGEVHFEGRRVDAMSRRDRAKTMLPAQLVFQNPFAALNPRHRVRRILSQAALIHGLVARCNVDRFVATLRSEERRVGKACVRPCRYSWSPDD